MSECTEAYEIDGLLEALVGVGLRESGQEVLVYDAARVEELLESRGAELSLWAFIQELDVASLGERAPMFVWLDDDLRYEIKSGTSGGRHRVH